MHLKFILVLVVVLTATALPNNGGNGVEQTRIRFKVSGRDLKDKHTLLELAPYVNIFYTQNGEDGETKLGSTEPLAGTKNPDWPEIFAFDFDRSKGQKWHFKVTDDDRLKEKDTEGDVWVKVSDFVDSDENLQVNLSKKGYLIIKRA